MVSSAEIRTIAYIDLASIRSETVRIPEVDDPEGRLVEITRVLPVATAEYNGGGETTVVQFATRNLETGSIDSAAYRQYITWLGINGGRNVAINRETLEEIPGDEGLWVPLLYVGSIVPPEQI